MRQKIIIAVLIIATSIILLIPANESRRADKYSHSLSIKEDIKSIAMNIRSKAISAKIDKIIKLVIRDKKYPPAEMYIVNHIDSNGYQCKLENGYADDSFQSHMMNQIL